MTIAIPAAPSFPSPLMAQLFPDRPEQHDLIANWLDAGDTDATSEIDVRLTAARNLLATLRTEHAAAVAARAAAASATEREKFQARMSGTPLVEVDHAALDRERDRLAALITAGEAEIRALERERQAAVANERALRTAAMGEDDALCFAAERIRMMLFEQQPGSPLDVARMLGRMEHRASQLEDERRDAIEASHAARNVKADHGKRYRRGADPRSGVTYEQLAAAADAAGEQCLELQHEAANLRREHERVRDELRGAVAAAFEHVLRLIGVVIEPGGPLLRTVGELNEQLQRFTRRGLPVPAPEGPRASELLAAAAPLLAIAGRQMPDAPAPAGCTARMVIG